MTQTQQTKGFVVKLTTKRLGGGRPAAELFDVTYPTEKEAADAVKRHCGTGPDCEIEVLEPLRVTDLGPKQVRSRF